MYCTKCGKEIPAGQSVCKNCAVSDRKEMQPIAAQETHTSFYLADFFKKLFVKNNIGTIIWMSINLIVVCTLFSLVLGVLWGIIIGLLGYALSVTIALSPMGEKILRWQSGCKKIKDPVILSRIQPLFDSVYAEAKAQSPELSDKIELFLCDEKSLNAFAIGRQTMCLTQGLLSMTDNDIKAIMGHEFGHLAHKDTDVSLFIVVGNIILTTIFMLVRLAVSIYSKIVMFIIGFFSDSFADTLVEIAAHIIIDFIIGGFMDLWTRIGYLICNTSSRMKEFSADEYSAKLGHGTDLKASLYKLDSSPKPHGIWAALNSTHPATADRIARLSELSF